MIGKGSHFINLQNFRWVFLCVSYPRFVESSNVRDLHCVTSKSSCSQTVGASTPSSVKTNNASSYEIHDFEDYNKLAHGQPQHNGIGGPG